jgi:hypothetical protein
LNNASHQKHLKKGLVSKEMDRCGGGGIKASNLQIILRMSPQSQSKSMWLPIWFMCKTPSLWLGRVAENMN